MRHFSDEPVARVLLENALAAAASAPSGANRQPWRFVVVEDPAVKARIRHAAEHEEELLYRKRASQEYLDALEPIGTDWNKPHLTDAPVLIVVFEEPWSWGEDGGKQKNYYVRESVGIAVGFLLVACTTRAWRRCPRSLADGFPQRDSRPPENERPFIVLPVGYPAADATVPQLDKKRLDGRSSSSSRPESARELG